MATSNNWATVSTKLRVDIVNKLKERIQEINATYGTTYTLSTFTKSALHHFLKIYNKGEQHGKRN